MASPDKGWWQNLKNVPYRRAPLQRQSHFGRCQSCPSARDDAPSPENSMLSVQCRSWIGRHICHSTRGCHGDGRSPTALDWPWCLLREQSQIKNMVIRNPGVDVNHTGTDASNQTSKRYLSFVQRFGQKWTIQQESMASKFSNNITVA